MIYNSREKWEHDEETEYRADQQRERDLARRCGFNVFEASHYTPAQMQAILTAPRRKATPLKEPYKGCWIVFHSYPAIGTVWNAHAEECPLNLQATFGLGDLRKRVFADGK